MDDTRMRYVVQKIIEAKLDNFEQHPTFEGACLQNVTHCYSIERRYISWHADFQSFRLILYMQILQKCPHL